MSQQIVVVLKSVTAMSCCLSYRLLNGVHASLASAEIYVKTDNYSVWVEVFFYTVDKVPAVGYI